ncbi:MAG: N-acetylmuramidase family protein [bacterium]|nr:N-acetylmuramidase family protein [bacterium]
MENSGEGSPKGTLIGFGGIGGTLFSAGLKTIGARAAGLGWDYRHYTWTSGERAGSAARSVRGPIILIWHSAGKKASDDFCDALGREVDLGFGVDSWLPGEDAHELIRRVYSIRAGRGGRFDVHGSNVVAKIVYRDETHTSIDDEPKLHDFIIEKMEALVNANPEIKPFYIGEGIRLGEDDFPVIAAENNMPEYLLRAVVEIEASGKGSHSSGALVARYEPHKAWKYAGLKRNELARENLAYANWKRGYPKGSPYPLIDQCVEIAGQEVAALATSWGLGQVMGFNHLAAGFDSAVDLVRNFARSEANQLRGMMNFIRAANLFDALLREDWQTFAEGYNGDQQAKHNYAGRLKIAAQRWKKESGSQIPPAPPKPPVKPSPGDPSPVPVLPELTLENLRKFTNAELREAAIRANDFTKLSIIVFGERDNTGAGKPAAETRAAINHEAAKPDEENTMAFSKTKSFLKSSTLIGIGGALLSSFFPASKPILDIFVPDTTSMNPETIEQLYVSAKQTFEALRSLAVSISLFIAARGRVKANTALTFKSE